MTMIGIDPHKATHTAVAIDDNEDVVDEFTLRASSRQVQRLREWAGGFTKREWAVESANGLGYLVAQQLVAAGETVFDVPPMLASRVRVLGSGRSQKNDPNDARSIAIAALRSDRLAVVRPDDHTRVLRLLVKRHRDMARLPTQTRQPSPRAARRVPSGRRRLADQCGQGKPADRPRHGRRRGDPASGPHRPRTRRRHRPARRNPRRIETPGRYSCSCVENDVDRHCGDRSDLCGDHHWIRQRRDPVPHPGALRDLQRHRTDRRLIRGTTPGIVSTREGTADSTTRSTSPQSPNSATTPQAASTTTARPPKAKQQKKPSER